MEAMCRQAIALGLRQIAFTEHVDYIPADIGYEFFRPDAYLAQVAHCRDLFGDRLTILSGVEIGEFHRFRRQADVLLAAFSFDLVVGSLHWVENQIVFEAPYFQDRSQKRAHQDYFADLELMCSGGGFDVLGHLDIVKRHGFDNYGHSDMTQYKDVICSILEAIIRNGIALEINTSTIRRPVNQMSPDAPVLNWYREMGGELLTIGSDAHTPADLAAGWDIAVEMALAAGYTHLTTFANRVPYMVPLENK
jgi:histidinol-phosphatase (PHP family)